MKDKKEKNLCSPPWDARLKKKTPLPPRSPQQIGPRGGAFDSNPTERVKSFVTEAQPGMTVDGISKERKLGVSKGAHSSRSVKQYQITTR